MHCFLERGSVLSLLPKCLFQTSSFQFPNSQLSLGFYGSSPNTFVLVVASLLHTHNVHPLGRRRMKKRGSVLSLLPNCFRIISGIELLHPLIIYSSFFLVMWSFSNVTAVTSWCNKMHWRKVDITRLNSFMIAFMIAYCNKYK